MSINHLWYGFDLFLLLNQSSSHPPKAGMAIKLKKMKTFKQRRKDSGKVGLRRVMRGKHTCAEKHSTERIGAQKKSRTRQEKNPSSAYYPAFSTKDRGSEGCPNQQSVQGPSQIFHRKRMHSKAAMTHAVRSIREAGKAARK